MESPASPSRLFWTTELLCKKHGRRNILTVDNKGLTLEDVFQQSTTGAIRGGFQKIRIPLSELVTVQLSQEPHQENNRFGCGCQQNRQKDLSSHCLSPKKLLLRSRRSKPAINVERRETKVLIIYAICRKSGCRWRVAELVCSFENAEMAAECFEHLRKRLEALGRPKRLLVFVNPYGGSKRAQKLYEDEAAPVFKLCNVETAVVITERANHAKEIVYKENLSDYDGIVSCGGDGLLNEVLHALIMREQQGGEIDINSRRTTLNSPKLPVGIIPAGSTNAMANSIHGTQDVMTSALRIGIGDRVPIDVCGVYDQHRFLRFATTAVAHGFLGDLLLTSERLRNLGPSRYFVSGVRIWLKNPTYAGVIRYKHCVTDSADAVKNRLAAKCGTGCTVCSDDVGADELAGSTTDEWTGWISENQLHTFGLVTPCICKFAPKGIAPNCHLGDGYMNLIVVPRITRGRNLALMAKIMSKHYDHMSASCLRLLVVKEFSFTPASSFAEDQLQNLASYIESAEQSSTDKSRLTDTLANDSTYGAWNIDGELLMQPRGTLYFRVHRQLVTMFGRGIEAE